ncbi:MAG: hypothetical protein HUJ62_01670, partial [Streptococcus gallolyticus]|nr:hypothetical protein [Streptococcus gallolyticus]
MVQGNKQTTPTKTTIAPEEGNQSITKTAENILTAKLEKYKTEVKLFGEALNQQLTNTVGDIDEAFRILLSKNGPLNYDDFKQKWKSVSDALTATKQQFNLEDEYSKIYNEIWDEALKQIKDIAKSGGDTESIISIRNNILFELSKINKQQSVNYKDITRKVIEKQTNMLNDIVYFNNTLSWYTDKEISGLNAILADTVSRTPNNLIPPSKIIDRITSALKDKGIYEGNTDVKKRIVPKEYVDQINELTKVFKDNEEEYQRLVESYQELEIKQQQGIFSVEDDRQMKQILIQLNELAQVRNSIIERRNDISQGAAFFGFNMQAFSRNADEIIKVMEGVQSIMDNLTTLTERRLEREQTAYEKAYNKRKQLIENNITDETEKNRKLNALETEKLRQDEQIQKQKEKLQAQASMISVSTAFAESLSKVASSIGTLLAANSFSLPNYIAAITAVLTTVGQVVAMITSIKELTAFEHGGTAQPNTP